MITFYTGGSVGVQAVGSIANKFSCSRVNGNNAINNRDQNLVHTIFLMTSPHIQMYVTLPCMIGRIKIGDLCKERARVFCQRVKSKIVNADKEELKS